jgi:Calx-beta domain/FG-GAP-like repeat/FG-GAP repeat
MRLRTLFDGLKTRPYRKPTPYTASLRMVCRPRLEALADRIVPSFSPAVDYAVGVGPSAVVSGEFNGDEFPDLAAANAGSNTVSVLLGNGDGTFQAARHFVCGREPTSIAVGDFNGDSRLDLATSDYAEDSVGLLLGNGDGTFQAARHFAVGPTPLAVAAGDFNGDGGVDLAVANGAVAMLLGNGDGTFQAAREVGPNGATVAVGDFNGDGRLDLAASYWVGDTEGGGYLIDVLMGNGDGTFSSPMWNVGVGSAPVAGDLNGDGRLDLVAVYPPDAVDYGSVYVMLGNGDGTFQIHTVPVLGASTCALGDISGDGRLDVVTTNRVFNGGSIDVLLGDGAGHFPTLQTFTVSPSPTSAVAEDYNGDGFADVVVGHSSAGVVSALINDGVWPPPPLPSVRINDVTVTEGHTGTAPAVFTVSLSHAFTEPVTVNYATAGGSAAAGSDYQAASGTLTFAPGETTKTVTVLVNGDRVPEPNEPSDAFFVNLSSPTNATLVDGQGFGIIVDDEPRISVSDVMKAEGKKGKTTLFTFTVTLSVAYDQPVTMSFATANGTATTSDGDYVAKSGTLTFAPGETTKTITIEVVGDNRREANETFYLDLFGLSVNALFTKNRGAGTILNDD